MGLPITPRGLDIGLQAAGFRSSTQPTRAYNDMQFWLGLNRVIDGNYRSGSGATYVRIELW